RNSGFSLDLGKSSTICPRSGPRSQRDRKSRAHIHGDSRRQIKGRGDHRRLRAALLRPVTRRSRKYMRRRLARRLCRADSSFLFQRTRHTDHRCGRSRSKRTGFVWRKSFAETEILNSLRLEKPATTALLESALPDEKNALRSQSLDLGFKWRKN